VKKIKTQVLIVGGGGAGLSASSFLADLGVDSLLVERHPATSHLPKAHYVNQRAMEIFRQHNMADAIYAKASPREKMGKILWRTPLGGDGPFDRRVIKAVDALGGGELTGVYDLHGVTPPTHITQMSLEPILREIAELRNPNKVLFSHELVSFTQTPKAVTGEVRNLDSGETFEIEADYLLAADAGKTIGPAIGVNMIGPTRMLGRVSVHFAADLSEHIPEDTSAMHCVINTNGAKAGEQLWTYLIAYGPDNWGRNSEEWGISLTFDPKEEPNLDEAYLIPRIKAFLQIDVPIKVLRVSHWFQEAMISDKFSEGRITLIGDAAHKHPPGGGLGLNSGIQDAHNISWKLALVLKGKAGARLLHSYEPERRSVVERNAEHSMLVMENFMVLQASLGVIDGMPPRFNQAQIAALFSEDANGVARRQRIDKVFEIATTETGLQDMDLGYVYAQGALIDDGSEAVLRDPAAIKYTPNTRPGSRLPHVWLKQNDTVLSSHDLIPMGGFLLIAGDKGYAWCAAAQKYAASNDLLLRAVHISTINDVANDSSVIDSSDNDSSDNYSSVIDSSMRWLDVCGISANGMIIVRPDGHVAYRSQTMADDANAVLATVFGEILAA
jgi:2,4-dichlorophenol 6-monooxygenase